MATPHNPYREEHRKRKDRDGFTCPFFATLEVAPPSKAQPKASSSKPVSRQGSKSKPQHQDVVIATKTFDGDLEGEVSDSGKSSTSALPSKTPAKKPRATTRSTKKGTAKTPRARSTSQSVNDADENEEEQDLPDDAQATVKKKKTITRSRSKSVAQSVASDMDVDDDPEMPAAPPTVKKQRTTGSRSKSKSVASGADDDESETIAEEPTATKKKGNKTKKAAGSDASDAEQDVQEIVRKPTRKGKAKAKAPPETEEEEEVVEEATRKPSKSKSKGPQTVRKPAPSRSRSKSKVVNVEMESETASVEDGQTSLEETQSRASARNTSSSTAPTSNPKGKAKQETIEPASEDEFGPIIEQPPFAPAALAKANPPLVAKKSLPAAAASIGLGKPPLSKSKPALVQSSAITPLTSEDDPSGLDQTPPPPTTNTEAEADPDVEMTPLVIPKRTTKPKSSTGPTIARKPSRSSQSTKPVPRVRGSSVKVQPQMVVDLSESDEEAEVAKQVMEDDVTEVVQVPLKDPRDEMQQQNKDEYVDLVVETKVDLQSKTKGKAKAEQRKSKLLRASVFMPSVEEKEKAGVPPEPSSAKAAITPKPPSPQPLQPDLPSQSEPAPTAEVVEECEDLGDVSMQETEIVEASVLETDVKMDDAPTTFTDAPCTPNQTAFSIPLQPTVTSQTSSPKADSSQAQVDETAPQPARSGSNTDDKGQQPAQFFPPLSKMPFVPLHELTEAELDMTVEEWIRYQMDVEYDKFKRDGERELQRLRKEAEKVRKVIEGL